MADALVCVVMCSGAWYIGGLFHVLVYGSGVEGGGGGQPALCHTQCGVLVPGFCFSSEFAAPRLSVLRVHRWCDVLRSERPLIINL